LYKNDNNSKRIRKEWHRYFRQLNETEKKSVLQMLKTFLKTRKESTEPITIEEYNKEIDEAMEEVKRGEVYPHDEVVKMAKRKVTWTRQAIRQLNATIEYIRKDSEQNAYKVKEKLLNKINRLAEDKTVHRKDPYKRMTMANSYTLKY
jgi:ParE toxin of type II toxin-antitoxin system, parDE